MPKNKKKSFEQEHILAITKTHQYQTVEELFEKCETNPLYYLLLIVSTFIIASGLMLNNDAIVIGGMIITPVLTPILLFALGLSVGEPHTMFQALIVLIKSLFLIIGISLILALMFGPGTETFILDNSLRTAVLYLIVSFFAGLAATYAWARKEVSDILPGIAIAVSIVPPISLIGLSIAVLDFEKIRFFLLIAILNIVGAIVGSLIVFVMLKFPEVEKKVELKSEEIEKDLKAKK